MRKAEIQIDSFFGEPSIGAWESTVFFAAAFQEDGCIRLDVFRKDMEDGITWDELQKIKNGCGFKHQDAIEFYPKDSDVINTGNYRHLYIMAEPLKFIRRQP